MSTEVRHKHYVLELTRNKPLSPRLTFECGVSQLRCSNRWQLLWSPAYVARHQHGAQVMIQEMGQILRHKDILFCGYPVAFSRGYLEKITGSAIRSFFVSDGCCGLSYFKSVPRTGVAPSILLLVF